MSHHRWSALRAGAFEARVLRKGLIADVTGRVRLEDGERFWSPIVPDDGGEGVAFTTRLPRQRLRVFKHEDEINGCSPMATTSRWASS